MLLYHCKSEETNDGMLRKYVHHFDVIRDFGCKISCKEITFTLFNWKFPPELMNTKGHIWRTYIRIDIRAYKNQCEFKFHAAFLPWSNELSDWTYLFISSQILAHNITVNADNKCIGLKHVHMVIEKILTISHFEYSSMNILSACKFVEFKY